ncbi:MAG: quinoprotein dehydrogenase-associated SoxYZ-like carrier [Gammaproteobacteria bacterium]|nr:quinoprotein dehydrogenase-associated SoxYZ-like carrier [Gammaproteobacteria bacterium]
MDSSAATNLWLRRGIVIFLIALLATGFATHAGANNDRWAELKSAYFGDRDISSGDNVITMEAPSRAYDAATVPIVIRAVDLDSRIKQVHLFVDKNPLPLAGIFKFNDVASSWEWIETRIRINEYTDVRAIAELGDGSLHMTSRFVKAAGGCSAPAMADMAVAMKRAGKMKLLLDASNDGIESSAEAVIKISHPNNSGMQFDQISRNYIPAFFVQNISAEINGKPLIDVETNFSLSENPVVRFAFKSDLDVMQSASEMLVYAVDSKGNRYEKSLEVENRQLSLQ